MTAAERAADFIDGTVRAISSPVISGLASFNRWRLPPRDAPHPQLTGIHQPMSEELTLTDLVAGRSPCPSSWPIGAIGRAASAPS